MTYKDYIASRTNYYKANPSVKSQNNAIQVLNMVKSLAPIRTGNLRFNGTQLHSKGTHMHDDGQLFDVWEITIGGDRAPYAVYTNEPWISPKWNGKKNPNEGWIDDAIEVTATFLSQNLKGRLEKNR